jgi:hypothetical protein
LRNFASLGEFNRRTDMDRNDDQQLWDLLGSSRAPEASPFFSRDVLRRLREESPSRHGFARWLSWRRLLPVSGLVAATAAIFVAYTVTFQHPSAGENDVVAKIDAQDYEVVADLDNLLASEDNNLWDDNPSL